MWIGWWVLGCEDFVEDGFGFVFVCVFGESELVDEDLVGFGEYVFFVG